MTRYAQLPLLLLAFQAVPAQAAYRCYRDAFGRRRCTGLARGARIGIGVAIAVGFLFLMMLLLLFRRRRMQRRNMAFISQPTMTAAPQPGHHAQPHTGAYAASPYGGPAQHGAPQFPAAAHHTAAPAYNAGSYAPPAGPPPGAGGYAPPPGPPPVKS